MNRDSKRGMAVAHVHSRGMRVTPDGRVIGIRGKILRPYICTRSGCAYREISVALPGKSHTHIGVCCLQAYQKFGDRVYGNNVHIRHLNGNSLDDTWHNIGIGSASDNMMDVSLRVRLWRSRKAALVRRKFTMETVNKIRKMRKDGAGVLALARLFKVSKGHMSQIVNRKIYKQ